MIRTTRGAPDGPHRASYRPAPAAPGAGNAIGVSPTGRLRSRHPLPRFHAAPRRAWNRSAAVAGITGSRTNAASENCSTVRTTATTS
ncbi:hypothetical protein WI61_13695 [Burkholderia cepacia]|nr:hypothetical protein WI47_18465 [Burkholderia cepacia]KVA53318.1 hypothetical protein WI48_24155 [Burkholderia cepacia]KVA67924.1 hypothetical protein WI49_10330 [Burkholderia cepacia]KVA82292.1 hypothetical protein WI50_23280 [Burkholderia cepacia]KVA86228.1 hypothetical protein WI52_14200 [Burkholderia cepacia]